MTDDGKQDLSALPVAEMVADLGAKFFANPKF